MSVQHTAATPLNRGDIFDIAIRLAAVVFLVVMSIRVFHPFLALMLWALILAVALHPLHQKLAARLAGRPGRAATVLILIGLLTIGIPASIIASVFASNIHQAHDALVHGELDIKPPPPGVATWPVIGKTVSSVWQQASDDLPALVSKAEPQLKSLSRDALQFVASSAGGILKFIGSLIVAGIMLAYSESGAAALRRIAARFAGPERGPAVFALCQGTINSVALGVIGVAFIQSLLLGGGFVAAGVPAAGLLAFLALLGGIAQLPALIITLPVIGYIWWSGGSATMNVLLTIYLILAGLADNVLKPLLLGRGVDAPMPVVLLGALGGVVANGILGMFIGAVVLAVGYQLFMDWVDQAQPAAANTTEKD